MSTEAFGTTLSSIIDDMKSGVIDRQAKALNCIIAFLHASATQAVNALEMSPDRYLIFERLFMLGPAVVEPLKAVLARTNNDEVRVLASIVLLNYGFRDGLETLLVAVRSSSDYACLAAQCLASNRIVDAENEMIERIERCSSNDSDLVVCLVDALERMGRPAPDGLLARVTAEWPPWKAAGVRLKPASASAKDPSATTSAPQRP